MDDAPQMTYHGSRHFESDPLTGDNHSHEFARKSGGEVVVYYNTATGMYDASVKFTAGSKQHFDYLMNEWKSGDPAWPKELEKPTASVSLEKWEADFLFNMITSLSNAGSHVNGHELSGLSLKLKQAKEKM